MPNNIAITAGSGTSVATDLIGSDHHQLIKVEFGVEDSATMVSSTNPLPVTTPDDVFTVTPTLDTGNAYAAGDVLFVVNDIANVTRASGIPVTLTSVVAVDKADLKVEMLLLFFDSTVTLGTLNAAVSISDADALKFVGAVFIAKSDWVDLGGVDIASPDISPRMMKPATTSLFVCALTVEAATFTNGDLQFRFGFAR